MDEKSIKVVSAGSEAGVEATGLPALGTAGGADCTLSSGNGRGGVLVLSPARRIGSKAGFGSTGDFGPTGDISGPFVPAGGVLPVSAGATSLSAFGAGSG